ncbi:hypothetical protein KOI35_13390 [Actinoplanes bogorensis]|uniref:Uncharacterized protein n=1 Tax=Paractinoplanes bogorensis TaxID=1610840 RepID=A0ABS5YN65_9ACTN|nr:hypothetical protein [Actinoplanes bogorensis]MBU2664491.1 hypothetical protein [Actinoplanes bogorensis]
MRGLLAGNGLFMAPGLEEDGKPQMAPSAYGLAALARIDGPTPAPADPDRLARTVAAEQPDEPLWTAWYATRVEQSSGRSIAGNWASAALTAPLPDDPDARIAAIAAVTDVVADKKVGLPDDRRRELGAALTTAVPAATGDYGRCRAAEAADRLNLDPGSWRLTPAKPALTGKFSADSVMRVWGAVCLADRLGTPLSAPDRQDVLAWLRPNLGLDVAGNEFETYFLTLAWLAAGGPRADLEPLGDRLRKRMDGATGLLLTRTQRMGTLENTYDAALLAGSVDAFGDIAGRPTTDAVRALLPRLRANRSISDLLMAAVVLRGLDARDQALEREATGLARDFLARPLTRATLLPAAQLVLLLQQVGSEVPKFRGVTFPVGSREDRYLAWTMLGLGPFLSNSGEIRRAFADPLAQIGPSLDRPGDLTTMEVAAAMNVPDQGIDRNNLPPALTAWTTGQRGCTGFSALYRAVPSIDKCTLRATVEMQRTGLEEPA